jgi:flagellar hook-length control protein FliK
MEMTLVLQDPAFTAQTGRAPAPAGAADASMLFARTLQQELAEPGFVIGNMTEPTLTPPVQRAELTEWLRSFQDGRAAEVVPQTDTGSSIPLPSRPDNAEAPVVALLPASSATLSPLPEESAAQEEAPTLPTPAVQSGVIIRESEVAITAALPPLEAATPTQGSASTPADSGSENALEHLPRTPDSTRGEKRSGTPLQDAHNPRQKLQTARLVSAAEEPALPSASPLLQDNQYDSPAPALAAQSTQTVAAGELTEPAAEPLPLPQTATAQAQPASTVAQDFSDSGSSHTARRSFAIATGVPRPAVSGKQPAGAGIEPRLNESMSSTPLPAAQPEKTFASASATDSGLQSTTRNNSFRNLSASVPIPGMAEAAGDKLFQALAPQPVLAPQTDAAWMQQAVALAALNHAEAASSMPDIQSTNAAEPVFTLDTETPIGAEGWGEEVGSHISWLSEQKISKAELTLHPAELGAIDITINNEDERITVSIVTRNEAARELLQDNLPRLAELLRQNGLALEQGSVSQHSAGQREEQAASAQGKEPGRDNKDSPAVDTPRLRSALLHQGQIDHYV